ncbi:DCAKD [Branchiostoma lanceolatum]|uniref:Dephospho-CoA kinase domain-containing protein n=2 Tax=Branchiostoma lanceolatum TaxID=7740 RepID=A0A8J9YQX2_BRALA|nr:DCAKD [Branchiostoma lanceolatum]
MLLVGLTGSIATGKSTVSSMFKELGVPAVDADQIAKDVVEPGMPAFKKILAHFGPEILQEDGQLNRERLGQIIFSDKKQRKVLNSLTHPAIHRHMVWQVIKLFCQGHKYTILDIPLLFETSNLHKYLHSTVVVSCEEETQLERLIARNHYEEDEARNRIQVQMPLSKKIELADHIIENSGDLQFTKEQVLVLHQRLCTSYKRFIFMVVLGILVLLYAVFFIRNMLTI